MDLGWLSLIALLIVLAYSCTSTVNPGVLAIVFAWIIGVFLAPRFGKTITGKELAAGFPTEMFLIVVGVSLLFTQAQVNGTLDRVAHVAVKGCRGNVGTIPVMFFFLSFVFAAVGAGNIAATAIMAPLAMAVAERAGIPGFLMAIMVVHGALAGGLSPISPTGLIASNLMDKIGLSGQEWPTFLHNFLANTGVGLGGYLIFGGWRLFGRTYHDVNQDPETQSGVLKSEPLQRRHLLTLAVIVVFVGIVLCMVRFGAVTVGLAALAASVCLTLGRLANEQEAIRKMPWSVILMVCGVTVLTSLLEKTGGTDRFIHIMAGVSNEQTAPGIIAFVAGLVSVYASTSGVILPTFLPMVPGMIERVGGDPGALASSVIIGGHLVDCSPLSTLGALCVACAPVTEDRRRLFNQVLVWGLSMSVVGALLCYVFFGLGRAGN